MERTSASSDGLKSAAGAAPSALPFSENDIVSPAPPRAHCGSRRSSEHPTTSPADQRCARVLYPLSVSCHASIRFRSTAHEWAQSPTPSSIEICGA